MDNRFYFEDIHGSQISFLGQEYNHITKVRRAKVGDDLVGFNGDGYDYSLKISEILKDRVICEIIDRQKNKASEDIEVTVYLAMIKHDALTDAIDFLTQMNVTHLKLFKADNSIADIDTKKLEKLKNIVIQACKQSERASAMTIDIIQKSDISHDILKYDNRYFAYEDATQRIKSFSGDFAVIIGPEGGFSSEEVRYFSSFATVVSLSKTILRSPVACVSAVSALKAVNNDC